MKKLVLAAVGLFAFGQIWSQTYSFTATSGTYTANSSPTQLLGSSSDEGLSASTPIGFTFIMGCDSYTTFVASSNGWMGLGGAAYYSELTNDLTGTSYRPKIAPLWDDLETNSSGSVNYQLTGSAPNRVLTVEWKQMLWTYSGSTWAISFQAKLYETSNQIDFVYTRNGNATANITSSASASIGLALATSGSFYSLNGTGTSPTASTTTETTTLASKPATGQIYRFSNTSTFCSGTPTGGSSSASPTTTTCSNLNTTLSATGMSAGCGYSYQWQSSTDNATWTNITGATTTNYTVSNAANTYYRLVTTCTGSGLSANGSSTLVSFSGTVPSNNLPCNATSLTLGVSASGTTDCADGSGEPSAPSCWYNGNLNTVWYSVVCPASGKLKIKTTLLSSGIILQNTQIAVYSGTCGSGMTYVNCNDDAPTCGSYTPLNSELSLTGLTAGATYYIVVDGYYDQSGAFEILAIDGNSSFPLVTGQDCPVAFPVCNNTMTIGNPGYQSIGGQCDNSGTATSECTSGEANAVWYSFSIASAGTLSFDIVPNDYGNPNPITGQSNSSYSSTGDETDYDWVLWKVGGSGATSCSSIMSSGGDLSSACNFSYLGVTGCSPSGNAPATYGTGFDAAYEVGPSVVAGETYMLAIHNYSNSTSGFTLQFPTVGQVIYTTPTTLNWTGGANTTSWTTSNNWGGCGTPSCGMSAVVTTASSYQPVLTAGTYNVNDITINTGATLTLQSGATLNVCGNFTNNGNLVCQAGSTVVFVGSGTQNITGSFVGVDAFANLTVNKLTGTVVCNNNVDMTGNFLTNNTTSIFNSNGMYIKVGGNFTNNNGNTTYTNTGTAGTLEFYGTAGQNYNQGSSQLDLNKVVMNHTGTNVVLLTDMFIKSSTGTLTLTLGKIQTGSFRVDVSNSANSAVSSGNASSYVYGNLYRTLNGSAGAYGFPLGTASLYELALINFTTTTTIPRLQTRFDSWGTPALHTNGMSECATTYNLADENMGYWTINASANPTSGTYNTTLYCNGATNIGGAAWTVEKSSNGGSTWVLSGTCDPTSTAAIVKRNGMNGFSIFAAAQATNPLPVELINFYGYHNEEANYLHWRTESEHNSSHFLLERSRDGEFFTPLVELPAAGNSTTAIDYMQTDAQPYYPVTYYRLNEYDNDGKSITTDMIAIQSGNQVEDLVVYEIYPNPSTDKFTMEYSLPNPENITIEVVDGAGRRVLSMNFDAGTDNVTELAGKDWQSGVYLVSIKTASGLSKTLRIEKM